MSWLLPIDIDCPKCGRRFSGHAAESINVGRMPRARELILSGDFHVEVCPGCACRVTVERTFLYIDFERRHFVHVFKKSERGGWQACEELAARTFSEAFRGAPATMHELSRSMTVRAVFGMAALAEKLRIWDAGLDDAIIELLKLDLITSMPELADKKDREVLLLAAPPDQRLEFLVRDWDATEDSIVEVVGADRARYLELGRDRQRLMEYWPGLSHMPYVSYRRLAREPARRAGLEERS